MGLALAALVDELLGQLLEHRRIALGVDETWVMDRTGHQTSNMVNRYRRVARTVAEAELGDLAPLDEAIPEVAAALAAVEAAAEPKKVDAKHHSTYRNNASNGPIAQSVELRTFNSERPRRPKTLPKIQGRPSDSRQRSEGVQPLPAAATATSLDPVEAALTRSMLALAGALEAAATTEERIAIARELGDVARALEGHRVARTGIVNLDEEARRRGRR